eukprot:m.51764 g.51764  ORF g.51764 m.51764 type:complete len:98 (+) comp11260_c0_seq2:509-802(+)
MGGQWQYLAQLDITRDGYTATMHRGPKKNWKGFGKLECWTDSRTTGICTGATKTTTSSAAAKPVKTTATTSCTGNRTTRTKADKSYVVQVALNTLTG